MSSATIWAVVIGMGLLNFALRFMPIAILSRIELPEWIRRWLSYVPVSVMATLVVGEVLRPDGVWVSSAADPYVLAALFTAAVYWRFRSFPGATVAGVLAFLALRAVLG